MAKQWHILHLSDLHIHNPNKTNGSEHLRNTHFDEYLRQLAHAVRKEVSDPIDCLAITGDFVDRGRVQNFDHAKKIIEFALKEFKLNANQVVVCPGNHDLLSNEEQKANFVAARKPYCEFASQWANGNAIERSKTGRSVLCKLRNDLWVLSIDCTLGAKSSYIPGPGAWLKRESKELEIAWVKNHLQDQTQLLVVLSHYPFEEFKGSVIPDEEEHFHEKHIWTKGKEVANRIGTWRGLSEARTLWLTGDIHVANRGACYGIDIVTAGTLGTRIGKRSQQPRQAKLIRVTAGNDLSQIWTFNYEMPGHADRSACGDWSAKYTTIPNDKFASANKEAYQESNRARNPKNINTSELKKVRGKGAGRSKQSLPILIQEAGVETVDPELEAQIITSIAENKLYAMGRFETNETITSLSWVSIGPLLNITGILPVTVTAMHQWLATRLRSSFGETLFLGIDCWGAVLASQLSILSGAPNFCVASRGSEQDYTPHEQITDRVIKKVKECRSVVLVHDVVGTGQSLRLIHDQVCDKLDRKETSRINWFALSIICDNSRVRESCKFITAHGTACSSLRMPILAKSQLPDERVLPPQLSFSHASKQP